MSLLIVAVVQLSIVMSLQGWTAGSRDCGAPPAIRNARPSNRAVEGAPHGALIRYFCNRGYSGVSTSYCQNGQWSDPRLTCQPRSCGNPGTPAHGRTLGRAWLFGDKVEHRCNHGYWLQGLAIRYCQADGSWTRALPTCKRILCPALPPPHHGEIMTTHDDFRVGTVVQYSCDPGYNWRGTRNRTCSADGTWTGQANGQCEELRCPQISFYDGEYTGDNLAGERVNFQCFPTTILEGSRTIWCNHDGQWSDPVPKCWRQCHQPQFGRGTFSPQKNLYDHLEEMQFSCSSARQAPWPSSGTVMCNNGTWLPNPPTCNKEGECHLTEELVVVGYKAVVEGSTETHNRIGGSSKCWDWCKEKCGRRCYAYSLRDRWYGCQCYTFDRFLTSDEFKYDTEGVTMNRVCEPY